MKYADINRRFTEIVAEWLAKGYSINTASMSGSQGETAKIDLTDGKEIVRILVDRFSDYAANVEGVEIIVGKALDADVRPNNNDNWATLWNNRLEVLQQERFFKIGENRVAVRSTAPRPRRRPLQSCASSGTSLRSVLPKAKHLPVRPSRLPSALSAASLGPTALPRPT